MVTLGQVRYPSATDRGKCKGGDGGLTYARLTEEQNIIFSDHLQLNDCNLILLYSKSLSQKNIL